MVGDRAGVLAAVLLVAAVAGPAVAAGAAERPVLDDGATGGAAPAIFAQQAAPETDNTITRIAVHEDGSATWELRIRTRLETEADVREYQAFQAEFRENTTRYLGDFRASIDGIVANARTVTGREMRAEGYRATTSVQTVPRRWGVVAYEFRWVGFAAVEGDRLVVGDVFEGGLFIADGDALEVVGPAGYRIASVAPDPDESSNGTVSWQGREDFSDGRPRVVLAPEGAATTGGFPSNALVGGAGLLVVVALASLGFLRWRRGGTDGGAAAASESAGSDGDGELLADEDYVRRALADSGGRMRQTEVKEALGWSKSKTSRVLGRMEEAGTVRKLRLGRENVIDLADESEE